MKRELILALVKALLGFLDEEMIKGFLDKGLDWVEDSIQESENVYDDALLPLIAVFRNALNIPDDD